jgi:hypothetical protein
LHYEAGLHLYRRRFHRNNSPAPDLHPIKKASALNFADLFKARTPHSKPLTGGYMKQPIESIASIAAAIKLKSASVVNTMQSWHERRKRVKRVQNLRQSSSEIRVNPGNHVAQIHKARYFEIQLEQWRKEGVL